jgi:hypothetical protein
MDNTPDGVTSSHINYNVPTYMAMAAFTAVAWYNALELNVQVFLTFKRHRGLYFWSLIISSWGCVLHALGFLLKFFQLSGKHDPYLAVTIITIGWYAMVTGQAVVLYSRLHLVVREQKVLRGVLAMIIVDAFCFHIPTTVLTFGSNSKYAFRYTASFNIFERLQMTAFCIQEFIISGIYVYSTIRLLRPVYHGRTRKVMMQLIWINMIIIGMDIVLLAMEYGKNYEIEATLKAMVYSIKLKLEFAVLNQLMTLANSSVNSAQQLHVPEADEKGKAHGRMKSQNNITRHVNYPGRPKRTKSKRSHESRPSSTFSEYARSSSFGANSNGRLKWVPSLDRHCPVKTQHVEHVDDELNVFTNPAACFRPAKDKVPGFPPHDGLGGIPGTPRSDDVEADAGTVSPTETGDHMHGNATSHHNVHVPSLRRHGHTRRAPPPPQLDLEAAVMPNGLLRSSRPSVADWAHGPDSDPSPCSDEVSLNPYDLDSPKFGNSPTSPGTARLPRRGMSQRQTGMDFMTSALRE